MITKNVIPLPHLHHDTHWKKCPVCGKNDGYLNLGAEQWFVCRAHKTKWLLGENLSNSWKNQTIAEYLTVEQILDQYDEVLPSQINDVKSR